MPSTSSRSPWPLVGRHEELALLARELERPASCGVIIAGAPGVGKTRLRGEALARLRRDGWLIREVTATEAAATIPFGPLAPLLPEALSMSPLDVLRHSVRELRQERGDGRLVVSVDDAHLLDAASSALLHQLASTQTASLLLTARSGEALPDPIVGLRKEGAIGWIELQPLSRTEVEALLGQALDGHLDAGTRHELSRLSQGNALFLRELVEIGLGSGALAERDGVWRWEGEPVAAGGPLEAIQQRLRPLSAPQREAAEALALAEPLPLDVLERLAAPAVIRELEAVAMITTATMTEGYRRRWQVRLAHPLYAEALRGGLTPLRRRELLGRIGDALEATPLRRGDDSSRLAMIRLEAGHPVHAESALAAARWMLGSGHFDTAAALARAALDSGAGFPAEIALSRAMTGLCRPEEAQALLEAARPVGAAQAVELALASAQNLHHGLGRADRAREVLSEALGRLPEEGASELIVARARLELSAGRLGTAESLSTAVLESAGVPLAAQIGAIAVRGLVLAFSGRPLQAVTAFDTGVELLRDSPELLATRSTLLTGRWMALCFAGRIPEAARLAVEVHDRLVEASLEPLRGYWTGLVGWAALLSGRSRTARSWLEEGASICHRYMAGGGHVVTMEGVLAQAASFRGDLRRAETALAAARAAVVAPPTEEPWIDLCEAWVLWAQGETSRAAQAALRAAAGWHHAGFSSLEAWALHDAARLGDLFGVERLVRLADGCEGDLIPALAAHVRALADADGPGLERISLDFERMGLTLLAAEAATEAAEAHRRAGMPNRARVPMLRSAALTADCEQSRSPVLARTATRRALTHREFQVAQMASGGASSADLAARLGLSVRTVENHLQQAYSKLGVSSRAQLAVVLASVPAGVE
ncbi:MAG: LuxR C-terminal-related transcriptional regulator [Candidatus Dormibacteria bacterium]|jgi:DNA-binding CsgD family transcriptional regulator